MRANFIFVSITPSEGAIRRYEVGGEEGRNTHSAIASRPLIFTDEFVEMFRGNPPEEFKHEEEGGKIPPSGGGGMPHPQPPCDTEAHSAA